MKDTRWFVAASVLLFLIGCKKETVTSPSPPILALRSVLDTLAYSFTVEDFSYYEHRLVSFSKDTVLARVSVTSFGGGTATFTLYNSSHSAISVIPLLGISAQDLTVIGRPGYFSIGFDHWTGTAAILVTPK